MSRFAQIAYVFLFGLLLLQPHLITGHFLGIPAPYALSISTVFIVGVGAVVYYFHQRDIEKQEQKSQQLSFKLEDTYRKLLDSFKYIGVVNLRLPLLRRLTSGLVGNVRADQKGRRRIFENLVAVAVVSIAKKEWGILRFIDAPSGRTLQEFAYVHRFGARTPTRLSNAELLKSKMQTGKIKEVAGCSFFVTSDDGSKEQAHLVLPRLENTTDDDRLFLQAIVDQAQLFYRYTISTVTTNSHRL